MGNEKNRTLADINRRCVEPGCGRTPASGSFFCAEHKKQGRYKCLFPGCTKYCRDEKQLYCELHPNGQAEAGSNYKAQTGKPGKPAQSSANSQSVFTYSDGEPRHIHAGDPVAEVSARGLTIQILGAQKANLNPKKHFRPDTLIINCLGVPISARPTIVKQPKRLAKALPDTQLVPEELCLDIEDREAPRLTPDFWYKLAEGIIGARYTTVIACCMGGHGRTGTALACLLVAFGFSPTAEKAIAHVRKKYCHRAVESKAQENYVLAVERAKPRKGD